MLTSEKFPHNHWVAICTMFAIFILADSIKKFAMLSKLGSIHDKQC